MSHHRYLDVNRLLAIYFAARYDWPMTAPIGRDPLGSSNVGGEPNRLLRLCADVGAALEALSEMERGVIMYRWSLWVSREEEDGAAATARAKAVALPTGQAQKYRHLNAVSEEHRAKAKKYTSEIRKHEERKGYTRAMEKLRVELVSRDLVGQAVTNGRCGVQR